MTSTEILVLCGSLFALCGLFEVLVILDRRSRQRRSDEHRDALSNSLDLPPDQFAKLWERKP